jgi:KUP system potassium uptake protein
VHLREGTLHQRLGWKAPFDLVRVPGTAVFLTSNAGGTPPLLTHHVRHNRVLHQTVVLITVVGERVPRVYEERAQVRDLGQGFYRVFLRYGFSESPHVPAGLAEAQKVGLPLFRPEETTYFLGRETIVAEEGGRMGARAERLFAFLARNAQPATRYFHIPPQRVVEIGLQLDL